ncbi:transposon Tf2-9 polyprotein [Trichonephila clavipes]|nr:transposon Tf2-9 polyprotein [Trichonephila clavipes]
MTPKWSPKSPNWPPTWSSKMMPTWLYRQDFAKFSLNRHYNKKPTSDPKNVVIHTSENQLAAFKNFVVIYSRHHRKSANRQVKKEDLIELAEELGLIVEAGLTKPKLKDLIVKSPDYVEEDVKVMFDNIVKDRIRTEEKEEKLRREEREYELEKLRIQAEKNVNTMNNSENAQAPKLIHETFHKFNMKDDISLNLTLFERHEELTFLPKKDWLRELIIADQIKKNAPYEFQEHFLDEWSTISSPAEIAEKFEEYESVRRTLRPKFYNSFAKGRYEASGSSDTYFQRTEYLQGGSNRREKKHFQLNGTSYSGKVND